MTNRSVIYCSAALFAVASSSSHAVILADPGFEGTLVNDGNGVGKWNPFSNGGGNQAVTSTVDPRNGAQNLRLELVDGNSFAGVFQDVPVIAGGTILFSGWHLDLGGRPGGTEVRAEFLNGSGVEVSRTPNLVPTISGSYSEFTLSDTVPAGAETARLVYAIQSFGAPAPQTIAVDDMSVSGTGVVPEPTTSVLAALAALTLVVRRRR